MNYLFFFSLPPSIKTQTNGVDQGKMDRQKWME